MSDFKIVFTGPVGAGKTTAITTLSDTPPVTTDERASDMTVTRKPGTTVAMDYGMLRLDGGARLHLWGTPGQERFDFMWEILAQGGVGLVLLIDNTRPDPLKDLRFFLATFREFLEEARLAVGITRVDLRAEPGIEVYARALQGAGYRAPVFTVDARSRPDVSVLVQALLYTVDAGLV